MTEESQNPFQAPQVTNPQRIIVNDPNAEEPRSPWLVLMKWTVICGVSAAPSFFIALGTFGSDNVVPSISGMLAGIFVFILAYTFVETRPSIRELMSDPRKRLAARITYGIRIGMSILFPVAIYLDILTGLVSVGLSQVILSSPSGPMADRANVAGDTLHVFTWHFITTIIHGILMNFIVFALMLIVFAICLATYRLPDPRTSLDDRRVE